MKPRCTWSGYLKLSLVTVPIRVYTAVSTTEKITFNQLHKTCHQRIRQKLVCPVHGEVTREDIVKGYEYTADKFVVVNETELEAIRLETTSTIELVQFIRPDELDPTFLDSPYYLGPDGPVAEEGFAVMVEALRRAKLLGIGRVVLGGREKLVALKPRGKGLVFFTFRYVNEVRAASAYFEDISQEAPDSEQVALAQKLIESKSKRLNLTEFSDRHHAAVLDLIKSKIDGSQPVLVQRNGTSPVMSLMDALRQSVAQHERKPDRVAGGSKRKNVGLAA
jgi:DNA end-binding protein Ku